VPLIAGLYIAFVYVYIYFPYALWAVLPG